MKRNGAALGTNVKMEIETIKALKWGVGVGLKTKSGRCLWVYDAGDIISVKIRSLLYKNIVVVFDFLKIIKPRKPL